MIGYLEKHWKGKLPLWQIFWINLVVIAAIPHFTIDLLLPDLDKQLQPYPVLIMVPLIALYLTVFVWQAVGTLRATENHIRDVGAMTTAWGVYTGLLAALWILLTNVWGLWLSTQIDPDAGNVLERIAQEHASRYDLIVDEKEETVTLRGDIALGITRSFTQVVEQHPKLKRVTLESDGGNIYEARGLAKLIREARLHTHVEAQCSSACTTVFIGGLQRTLGTGARLGFHQYRIDADYMVAFTDPRAEQLKDRALFAEAGVGEAFLEQMYREDADGMWFPSVPELLAANVITTSESSVR